jgi:hypothetical protein
LAIPAELADSELALLELPLVDEQPASAISELATTATAIRAINFLDKFFMFRLLSEPTIG